MPPLTREIELKLEVDPGDLPLIGHDPLIGGAKAHVNHQVTVYYDTPETRLKNHAFTLRVRSADGKFIQTVKPVTDNAGLLSRDEVECEVASLKPDLSHLRDHPIHRLLTDSQAISLKEISRSEVNRTSWQVDLRNGRLEIDLDDGIISSGKRRQAFAELEFELHEGPPSSLIMAARRLLDRVPIRLSVLTKAERGFMLASGATGKVTKAAPVHVSPTMTVAEAFEIIVHACVKHYRLNEPLVIEGRIPEALHQCRVAMRRLRSALVLFRPAVEDVEFQHLRHELRWFTGQLGDARNLDVYLERSLAERERAKTIERREKAYDRAVEAMNSSKFRRLLIDLVGWVALGAWRSAKPARRSVKGFATRRLDSLWKAIAAADRDVANMDEVTRHDLRIQVKKLRYAVEFLRGVHPDARAAEKRFASAVTELQEALGKLNDMATAKTLGEAPSSDGWLIGSIGERRHLLSAEAALSDLLRTGPFWREHKRAELLSDV